MNDAASPLTELTKFSGGQAWMWAHGILLCFAETTAIQVDYRFGHRPLSSPYHAFTWPMESNEDTKTKCAHKNVVSYDDGSRTLISVLEPLTKLS